ncbi:hypothetical protein G3O06_04850 [Burkholderia sp. Ac-20345]|uniref:hypothetical protein n=1 Tax=Burkholderia sp. Ac-20345 TaxID=2703891 RepID=UPI00197BC766|nr:hypothetical protein [Burkholderia sp. Ac-20345]MBN3776899.1 hypothetical protein [Burkholderia sp. Ac-20345]
MTAILCSNAATGLQTAVTSVDVRQAFRTAGMKARVADLGMKFRILTSTSRNTEPKSSELRGL